MCAPVAASILNKCLQCNNRFEALKRFGVAGFDLLHDDRAKLASPVVMNALFCNSPGQSFRIQIALLEAGGVI